MIIFSFSYLREKEGRERVSVIFFAKRMTGMRKREGGEASVCHGREGGGGGAIAASFP